VTYHAADTADEARAASPSPVPPAPATRRTRAAFVAPDAVVVALVSLALAGGATVSLGQHRPWTTLPLAALLAWALWRAVAPRERATAARARWGRTLVLLVAAWVVLNALGHAEYLIVSRDPGFLTLSGMWLVDHPSTDIPSLGAMEAAATQANMLADASQAWNLRGTMIQPQGAKMLPALLSVGGWVGGTTGLLVTNVVVGGAGLLALGALAREAVGRRWSLVPVAILGLSVAHIGLSRSAYSEPLTLLLLCAGMVWAWRGIRERRLGAVVASAAVTGATSMVRIDGAAFAAAALVGTVVVLALTSRTDAASTWRWRLNAGLAFLLVQAAVLGAGYASLWRWSEAYLERLSPEATTVASVYALAWTVALVWVLTWHPRVRGERLLTAPLRAWGARGGRVAGASVGLGLLVLASRPLWTTVHRGTSTSEDRFTNTVVEYFQRAQGMPIDPTRTYAESTVTWLALYLTWPVVLLAMVGFALATRWALRRRPLWALVVVGALVPTLLYLFKPEIVPDQIWAIRRFESVTLPAFALAAAVGARWAVHRYRAWHARRRGREAPAGIGGWTRAVVALLPLLTWVSLMPGNPYPVSVAMHVFSSEMHGARAQVDGLCEVVDGRPVVLVGTSSHFGTLRVTCDVPVVLALVTPTPDTLRQMTRVWGQAPVVLTREPEMLTWTEDPAVVVDSQVYQAEYRLQGLPRVVNLSHFAWYAGQPNADGVVVPLRAGATASPGA